MEKRQISIVVVSGSMLWIENPVSTIYAHCNSEKHDMVFVPRQKEDENDRVIVFDYNFFARLNSMEATTHIRSDNENMYSFHLIGNSQEGFFEDLKGAHCELKIHDLFLDDNPSFKIIKR
ncbi:MAG: hypothetical protein KBD52_00990 [Candidatus Pacebacteria bacterium]|nr:hypothetical protein [Candidatus Paceibacterota bacterium]